MYIRAVRVPDVDSFSAQDHAAIGTLCLPAEFLGFRHSDFAGPGASTRNRPKRFCDVFPLGSVPGVKPGQGVGYFV